MKSIILPEISYQIFCILFLCMGFMFLQDLLFVERWAKWIR